MYFAVNRFTANGTQTQWGFNFSGGYISQDHIKVRVTSPAGEVTVPGYTWVGPNTIQITPAVTNGYLLEIYRDTPKELPLVDYTDGAIVNEKNLDKTAQQSVFAVAEIYDRLVDAETLVGTAAADAAASADSAATSAAAATASASEAANSAAEATEAVALFSAAAQEIGNYAAIRDYTGPVTSYYVRGVANIFDGGAGVFRVDASDTTSADNGGAILVDALGRRWQREWTGEPTIEWWGAATAQSLAGADAISDSYSSFAALLTWCSAINYAGTVRLGRGYYRLTQPLDCNLSLVFEGVGKNESYIHADHLAGPAIRFRQGTSGIRRLGVTASATRRAAAYGAGLNFGVLFEGDDVPENDPGAPRLLYCLMEDYYIAGHPQGAAHIVGPAFTGRIIGTDINSSGGHGLTFDRGEATGRTNLITGVISGVCRIGEGRINNCKGHAIAAGSPNSNFSTPALRVIIDNIEGGNNATDAAIRYYNAPVYLRGANHVYQNSALDVNAGGHSAVAAGRNIHLRNNRMLGGYANAYLIVSYDEMPTDGVFIDGMSIINPGANLNPAVLVSLPAGETVQPTGIHIRQGELGNIDKLIGTDATLGSGDFRRIAKVTINGEVPTAYKTVDSVVNNTTAMFVDPDLRMWLAPNELVEFECVIEYDGSATADLRAQMYSPPGSTLRYAPGPNSLKVGTTDTATVQSVGSGVLTFGAANIGVARLAEIRGFCQNGSVGGYLGLQWAQVVAEANDMLVLAGISSLRVRRIIG